MMMQKLSLLCLVSSLIGAAPIGGADRLIGVEVEVLVLGLKDHAPDLIGLAV